MTRKTKLAATILVLLALSALLIVGLRTNYLSRWTRFFYQGSQAPASSQASVRQRPAVPAPSISLQINSEHELTVFSGTPLIFKVRLGNHYAQNTALRNEAAKHHAEELRAAAASGQISQDRASRLMAGLNKPLEIPVLRVGDSTLGWSQFIHFNVRSPDGKQQSLTWPLTLASEPAAKSLQLDARTTGQAEYLLGPSVALQVPPGAYDVVAILEVPSDAKPAADRWQGRVQSPPVRLTIVPKPDHLSPAQEEEANLQLIRYYRKAKDSVQALQLAEKVLATNNSSIPALVMVGELKEEQGNLKDALKSYQAALAQFDKQYPNSYEPPEYLILKTSGLLAKLRSQEPLERQSPTP